MSTTPSAEPVRSFRPRYSLRTLLVLMTLLAVWLGYQMWCWNEREKAIAALEAIGAELSFAKSTSTPQWLTAIFGETRFRDVAVVNLHRKPATDEHVRHLRWFSNLETVVLNQSQVTDASMKYLAGQPKLRWLELESINISDAGLAQLQDLPSLIAIRVPRTGVTSAGVRQALPRFKNLKELWIDRTPITRDEVDAIRKEWPTLQVVYDRPAN